jgi:hypothetical protein
MVIDTTQSHGMGITVTYIVRTTTQHPKSSKASNRI